MKGSRNLTKDEVTAVFNKLGDKHNRYAKRNQLMFLFGVKTGFRISELLSIKVKDVVQYNKPVTRVTVTKANMKGNIESRAVALHEAVKPLILEHIKEADLGPDDYLFTSQDGTRLNRRTATAILDKAFELLQLDGKLSTHAMRKTFANNVHELLDHDLVKTQKALGHKWISTTAQYIAFREEDVDAAVMSA
jgi:integrase